MNKKDGRKQKQSDSMVPKVIQKKRAQRSRKKRKKRRGRFSVCNLCIMIAIVIIVGIFSLIDLGEELTQENEKSVAEIVKLQKQQQSLKAQKEQLTIEKNQLASENRQLQSNIQNLDNCLKVQLSRKNLLQDSGEVMNDYPVFVNAEESIPLVGFVQNTRKEAQETPILLTNIGDKKGFYSLKIPFLREKDSKVEIWRSKKFDNLEISEEGSVLIPLLNDKIHLLRITKEGEEYYLAFKWECHIE